MSRPSGPVSLVATDLGGLDASHPDITPSSARRSPPPQVERADKPDVAFLDDTEVTVLLNAPDLSRWEGRRDHALILLAIQTGLRISELLTLTIADITLGPHAHLRCLGKGRKQRAVPLTSHTEQAIQAWIDERGGLAKDPLFCARTGRALSTDAIQRRLTLYADIAAKTCPSLVGRPLSPHVLRHTNAMAMLHAGIDTTVIALWLGHADPRSTNAYLHADLAIKERALAKLQPRGAPKGRYQPPDHLLAFLEDL